MIASDRTREFEDQGYVLQRGFLSADEIEALREALREAQQVAAESDVLDRKGMTFKHNLWKASPKLREFITSPKVVGFLCDIVGPDLWVRWDQTIEKQPGGAAFPWHQDNGYNGLLDMHFQLWIALTPMTIDNGGLWLQPGSHKLGKVTHESIGSHVYNPGDESKEVLVPAEPGDALLFSSFMLHKTNQNVTEDQTRMAYVIEYMRLGDVDPFIEAPYLIAARRRTCCRAGATAARQPLVAQSTQVPRAACASQLVPLAAPAAHEARRQVGLLRYRSA